MTKTERCFSVFTRTRLKSIPDSGNSVNPETKLLCPFNFNSGEFDNLNSSLDK